MTDEKRSGATGFVYGKSSNPPHEIFWATGPCARCGILVDDEWEDGKDTEEEWWCLECWNIEEKRKLRESVSSLSEKLSAVIVHRTRSLACSQDVKTAYIELERDLRHARDELRAYEDRIVELEERVSYAEIARDNALATKEEAQAKLKEMRKQCGVKISTLLNIIKDAGRSAEDVLRK